MTFLFAWLMFPRDVSACASDAHIGVDALVKALGPRCGPHHREALGDDLLHRLRAHRAGRQLALRLHDVHDRHARAGPADSRCGSPQIVLPLGFALLALRFGQAFVRLWRGEETKLLSDEAEEALKLRQEGVDLGEVRE